jgi:uncharacterized protein (DUF927 family)
MTTAFEFCESKSVAPNTSGKRYPDTPPEWRDAAIQSVSDCWAEWNTIAPAYIYDWLESENDNEPFPVFTTAMYDGACDCEFVDPGLGVVDQHELQITIFESKTADSITKKIHLVDDQIRSLPAAQMYAGRASRFKFTDVAAFADKINSLPSNAAIGLGSMRSDLSDNERVTTKKLFKKNPAGAITRSRDFLLYPSGVPGLMLIDYDQKGMSATVRANVTNFGDFDGAIRQLVPNLDEIAHVRRASTSSNLFNSITDEAYGDSGGLHVYVAVADGGDIDRAMKVMAQRAWLLGLGWIYVGAIGQMLVRSLIDVAVRTPERLVFEGAPEIMPPLVQRGRLAVAFKGGLLDTRLAFPELTPAEQKEYDRLLAAAKLAAEPESQKKIKAAIEKKVKEAVAKGESPERARVAAERTYEQRDVRILSPLDVFIFDDDEIGTVTGADVLADPSRYDHETLADPLETHDEFGQLMTNKAILFSGERHGDVFVHSQLHGGITYMLRHDETSVRNVITQTHKTAVVSAFVRAMTLGGGDSPVSPSEESVLIAEVAKKSGANKTAVKDELKTAREARRPTDARAPDDDHFSGSADAASWPVDPATFVSFGDFEMTGVGLFVTLQEKDRPVRRWVCSPFELLGSSHDEAGGRWGVQVRARDGIGRSHLVNISNAVLQGDAAPVAAALADFGVVIDKPMQRHLQNYLIRAKPAGVFTFAEHTGWRVIHGSEYFVLPDRTIGGEGAENIILDAKRMARYEQRGTLDDWRTHVAAPAGKHKMAAFALSVAFAGPLLRLADVQGGGVHLIGNSSRGKSTLVFTASSVWGRGESGGFPHSWNNIVNALEGVAALSTDTLLSLDEIGEADPKAVASGVYALANGVGRGRANRDGSYRDPKTWRVMVLSSGEHPLEVKLLENKGQRARGGQLVRLIDVPVDCEGEVELGVFDAAVSKEDAARLAKEFQSAAVTYYGCAGPAFVEALIRHGIAKEDVKERLKAFESKISKDADGQVKRGGTRFALIGVAGELAIELGILPWLKGTAEEAAWVAFNRWIGTRGGEESYEERQAVERVRSLIELYGESRFQSYESDYPIPTRWGWRRYTGDHRIWQIPPQVFKDVFCEGLDHTFVAKVLAKKEMLNRGSDALTKTDRVTRDADSPTRVYVLNVSILDGVKTPADFDAYSERGTVPF